MSLTDLQPIFNLHLLENVYEIANVSCLVLYACCPTSVHVSTVPAAGDLFGVRSHFVHLNPNGVAHVV